MKPLTHFVVPFDFVLDARSNKRIFMEYVLNGKDNSKVNGSVYIASHILKTKCYNKNSSYKGKDTL